MTETTTVSSANDHTSGAQDSAISDSDNQKKDTVSYDTYSRTLNEAKKAKLKAQEFEAKIAQYEQEKLQAEGKKDEVISLVKKERDELANQIKKIKDESKYAAVKNQVEMKAKELGCVDTEAIIKLGNFSGLEVDDENRINPQSLELVLGKMKQDKPYLFSKQAPNIHDGAPANKVANGKVDISSMSLEEMKKFAMKNNIK